MSKDKPIPFDKKLIKQFHNLIECPSTIGKRIVILESMESIFEASQFGIRPLPLSRVVYENEEDRLLGMKYLLGTWEIIMNGLNEVLSVLVAHI